MPESNSKLKAAVEDFLDDVRKIRASGGGTAETSYYLPLGNLLNAVGGSLKPKVFCISQLTQQGADHPDFGLYAAKQVSKGQPKQGQLPECGVVEVKPASEDAWLTADSAQVSKYWGLYRLVLVTNTRDFVLLGEDAQGNPVKARRLSGWPTPPQNSRKNYSTPAPSPTRSARRWPSTWAAPCLTGPCWPNHATWPGCWPPTPATDWLAWRPLGTNRPWAPCVRRWRKHWA